MITCLDHFSAEHRACDDHFAAAEAAAQAGDWNACRAAWAAFVDATEQHFQCEEQQLFPAFEAATGITQGPTAVMRHEHGQMRQLFADVGVSLQEQDGDGFLGGCETLLMLMQQHNLKEENVLYPMCDQHIANVHLLLQGAP